MSSQSPLYQLYTPYRWSKLAGNIFLTKESTQITIMHVFVLILLSEIEKNNTTEVKTNRFEEEKASGAPYTNGSCCFVYKDYKG